jgi:hypothetical protein
MSYLQSIVRTNAVNLGGIVSIWLARKADIISMPDPVDGTIYGDIEFEEGKGWIKWDVTLGTAGLSSRDQQSIDGVMHNNELPFRIPLDIPGMREMLLKASDDEFVVLYKDGSGKYKIFGLLEYPVLFSFSHSTGVDAPEGRFFTCRFYFQGPDNVFFYEGELDMAPPGDAPAIIKWNGEVIATLGPGQIINFISDFGYETFFITE